MKVQFTKEAVEALIKAKCKSPALVEDEVRWSGVSIDTKFILPEDIPIIRAVLKKPEFWDHIENRRVIRKLDAVDALQESGLKQTKIKRLEVLAEAIRNVIEETPNKWVFTASAHGTLLPYFVTNVEYHPPQTNHNGRATPAYVSLDLGATARHVDVGHAIHFQREALPGTVEEILASKDIFIETEKLVSEYTADMEKYQKEAPKTGEQYLARGVGIPATEGRSSSRTRWHSDTIHFEKEGRAAKTVMDDESDQGDATGYSNTKFWFAKHTRKDDEEGEEAFKLPAHPIVRVFDLGRHEFFDTHIGSVDLYKYDAAASDKLVLPDEHKELVDALTGSVIEKMDDIITGKAGGVIVIASGAPGTGKTLTAEVYSEAAKRPLYMVQCSQLGTNEEVLEKKLALVLERAVRWRTILLIDEADVYIHERGKDIQQNAIVGVFLRLLEYYNGIMFLTTNRATVIDDAIMSRATAHIKYEIPTDDAKRMRLWKVMMAQYAVEGLDPFKAIQAFPKVSGRSIRQLLRLAKIMSSRNGTKVTVASLKWAAKFHDFSEAEEVQK